VAGLGIRLYTDEMIRPRLATILRSRGYDAESCYEVGLADQEVSDEEQLAHAAEHDRAILTFNMRDFLALDLDWKTSGRQHAGILLSPEIADMGALLRYVERHLDTQSPELQHDLLLWLDTSDPG
jgi:predicted nuclease of predicted toxin-antitoxin system